MASAHWRYLELQRKAGNRATAVAVQRRCPCGGVCASCGGEPNVQRETGDAEEKACMVKPTVSPTAVVEVPVSGKDIVEWITNMQAAIARASGSANAHATPNVHVSARVNDGVAKVSGSVTSRIWVPKLVRRKGDKLSDNDATIIAKYVRLTREHEDAHVANSVDALGRALCAGDGLPIESARTAVNRILCDELATADENLDAKSGTDEWVYNQDRTAVTDVNFIGTKVNYHSKDCSFL